MWKVGRGCIKQIRAFAVVEWAPDISRTVGSGELDLLLSRVRIGITPPAEYRNFRDMIVRATDESIPIHHTNWRIWQEIIARFRLFEAAEIGVWIATSELLGSFGILTPGCSARIPRVRTEHGWRKTE